MTRDYWRGFVSALLLVFLVKGALVMLHALDESLTEEACATGAIYGKACEARADKVQR